MSLLLLVLLIVLFFAVLSLHCCAGFSLVVANVGYSLAVGSGPLTVVASLVVERRLEGMSSSSCGSWAR